MREINAKMENKVWKMTILFIYVKREHKLCSRLYRVRLLSKFHC